MPLYTRIDYGHTRPISVDGYKPSLGESMAAAFRSAWNASPMQGIIDMDRMNEAQRPLDPDLPDMDYNELMEHAAAMPEKDARAMSLEEQERRIAGAGLEGMLKAREGYTGEALEILIEAKKEENRNSLVAASAPGWHMPFTFAAGLTASMLDPINAASAFVPVIGEARLIKMLGSATGAAAGPGKALLARSGIRAATGAASGLVGAAAVEPLTMLGQRTLQADYGMADSLLNLGFGAVFGAAFHAGFGALGEWRRKKAGMPQAWEYMPETEESADYLHLHADNIFRAYEDLINGMSPEELANSRLAGKSMKELRANALGTAIIYDSWARHYSYATQKPVGDFYRNYIIDYQSGELAPGNALEGKAGGDSLNHAMYLAPQKTLAEFRSKVLNDEPNAKPSYFALTGEELEGIDARVSSDMIRHQAKRHPNMTDVDNGRLPDILRNVDGENTFYAGKAGLNGRRFFGIQDFGDAKYGYVFDISPNGKVEFTTYFKDSAKALNVWKEQWKKKAASSVEDTSGEKSRHDFLDSTLLTGQPSDWNLKNIIDLVKSNEAGGGMLYQPELTGGEKPQAVGSGENPQYRRLAGEVEARNVQDRMDMEAEARRASLAESTEDVPGSEQIIVYETDRASSVGQTPEALARIEDDAAKEMNLPGAGEFVFDPEKFAHIDAKHGEQFNKNGFADANAMARYILENVESIYQAGNGALRFIRQIENGEGRYGNLVAEFEAKKDGAFYKITTVFPVKKRFLKNKKLLWECAPNIRSKNPQARMPDDIRGQSNDATDILHQSQNVNSASRKNIIGGNAGQSLERKKILRV